LLFTKSHNFEAGVADSRQIGAVPWSFSATVQAQGVPTSGFHRSGSDWEHSAITTIKHPVQHPLRKIFSSRNGKPFPSFLRVQSKNQIQICKNNGNQCKGKPSGPSSPGKCAPSDIEARLILLPSELGDWMKGEGRGRNLAAQ
jgi:hypothetical protein